MLYKYNLQLIEYGVKIYMDYTLITNQIGN